MEEHNAPNCGREHDLIGFLYGELSDVEKQSFTAHLNNCNLCRTQINEFHSVRESIVAWRDELLGGAYAHQPASVAVPARQSHSALSALRAFFDLSPLWMKGAVGFAALLFCMVTVLAVIQWRGTNAPPQAANSEKYSTEELNKIVEQRVQDELARRTNSSPVVTTSTESQELGPENKTIHPKSREVSRTNTQVAHNSQIQKAQRPLSRTEREQLAADLRLVSSNERSLNLLEDEINQ